MSSPAALSSPASGVAASLDTRASTSTPGIASPTSFNETITPHVTATPQHSEFVDALRKATSQTSLARSAKVPGASKRNDYRSEGVGTPVSSSGYAPSPSASEDDEVRNSDPGASSSRDGPSRRARLAAAAAAGAIPAQLAGLGTDSRRPPLVAPAASTSRSTASIPSRSHFAAAGPSDFTVSASSSRSNLLSQSKTSMYRQQASAASSSSHALTGNSSGDAPIGHLNHGNEDATSNSVVSAAGSTNLSRAKSVSSVSSVNSTSSMEAVPFRAAPLGNTRLGFGGYARVGGRPVNTITERRQFGVEDSSRSEEIAGSAETQGLHDIDQAKTNMGSATPQKQRVLPKGPTDDWLYRNAPGMGSLAQRTRAQPHTIDTSHGNTRHDLRNVFDLDTADNEEVPPDTLSSGRKAELELPSKSPITNIRSKLVKRAGKMGLKPLTSVPDAAVPAAKSSPQPYAGLSVQTEDLDASAYHEISPAIVVGNGETSNSINRAPFNSQTWAQRASAPLSSSGHSSSNIAAAFLGRSSSPFEMDGQRKTSSVTHAPLVVPKNPPGPPGTAPPPSPGLTGFAANPFASSVMSMANVSPSGDGSPTRKDPVGLKATLSPTYSSAARRPGSGMNSAAIVHTGSAGNRSSGSTIGFPVPLDPGTPPLTPAQQIQMEARAGVATVPTEPSGASPGPNSTEDGMRLTEANLEGRDDVRRPASISVLPPRIEKPAAHRFSGSIPPQQNRGNATLEGVFAKRPGFLRGISRESVRSLRSSHSSRASPSPHANITLKGDAPRLQTPDGSHSDRDCTAADLLDEDSPAVETPEPSGADRAKASRKTLTPQRVDSSTTPSQLPSPAVSLTSPPQSRKEDIKRDADGDPSAASATSKSDLPIPSAVSASLFSRAPRDEAASTKTSMAASPETILPSTALAGVAIAPAAKGHARSSSRAGRTAKDFYFGELLGEGSYSTVIEAWDLVPLREKGLLDESEHRLGGRNNALAAFAGKTSGRKGAGRIKALENVQPYAIKVLDKVHILKEKKQKYVGIEKEALSIMSRHPGVITLYWTFQDAESLYFVLEMAPKGELLTYIKQLGSFTEECAVYYAAQLLDVIESMHKAGVLHRDVKPENVLLDKDMRVRIADFGSAKILDASQRKSGHVPGANVSETSTLEGSTQRSTSQRPSSFVGTAEYVSPELLTDKQVSEASDIWAYGCILYQMLAGRPPFKGASEYQTFQKIMRREVVFPHGFSQEAQDLLEMILCLEPEQRPSCAQIRSHAFFKDFDWNETWTKAAPKLEEGLFKRPQRQPSRATIASSVLHTEEDSDGQGSANEGDVEADDGRSMQSSVDEHSSAGGFRRGLGMTPMDSRPTGAGEDDGSSLSDSDVRPTMRHRGLSSGAFASPRIIQQNNNRNRQGGSNLFNRVAANFAAGNSAASATIGDSSVTYDPSGNNVGETGANMAMRLPHLRHHLEASDQPPTAESQQLGLSAMSWAALLLPQESLLYACPVIHKTTGALLRSVNKRRQLLLTDFPRLLCVKETNDQLKVKSEIILTTMGMIDGPSALQNIPSTTPRDSSESEAAHSPAHAHSRSMQRQSSANSFMRNSAASAQQQTINDTRQTETRRGSVGSRVRPSVSSTSLATKLQTSVANITSGVGGGGGLIGSNAASNAQQTSPNFVTSVELKTARSFAVHTPSRVYIYEDPGGDASHWVTSITMAAKRYGTAAAIAGSAGL